MEVAKQGKKFVEVIGCFNCQQVQYQSAPAGNRIDKTFLGTSNTYVERKPLCAANRTAVRNQP